MSAFNPVRRMVLDIPVKWLVFAGLTALIIPMMDGISFYDPKAGLPLVAAFLFAPMSMVILTVKMPVWRLLPVSGRQIARAQWWLGMGAPMLMLGVFWLLALGVVELTGLMRTALSDAVIILGAQIAVCIACPAAMLTGGRLIRRHGNWLALVLILPVMGCVYAIAIWHPRLSQPLRLPLTIGGFAALAAAAMTYVTARPYIPPQRGMVRLPGARPAREAKDDLKGWASLAPTTAGMTAGFATLALIALAASQIFLVGGPEHLPPSSATFTSVMFLAVLPVALSMRIRAGLRVLRSLPIRGFALTAILQASVLVPQAAASGALFMASLALSGPGHNLTAMLAVLLGSASLLVPLTLRINSPIMIGVAMPFMTLSTLPASLFADQFPLSVITGGLVALAAGCLWSWWEISRGRHAYRAWPVQMSTWRGLGG